MAHALKHTLENLKKHWRLGASAALVIAMLFLLFNLLLFTGALSKNLIANLKSKISFNVYLKEDTDFFTIRRIMENLEKRNDVIPPVTYTSPEEAQNSISASLGLTSDFLKKYRLKLPGSLTVTPVSPAKEKTIKQALGSGPFSSFIAESPKEFEGRESKMIENVSKNLERLQNLIRSLLAILVGFTAFAGILTVFITLELTASLRKKELFIMKLVGASPATLELPYLIEGIAVSVIGLVFGAILFLLTPPIFFEDPFLRETFQNLPLGNIFVLEFLASIAIGGFGSLLMIRKLMFSKRTLHLTL